MSAPDLSEFIAMSKRDQKRPCQVAAALERLGKDERAQLAAACAADKYLVSAGAIRQWLTQRGFEVSIPAIGNHRRAGCSCDA